MDALKVFNRLKFGIKFNSKLQNDSMRTKMSRNDEISADDIPIESFSEPRSNGIGQCVDDQLAENREDTDSEDQPIRLTTDLVASKNDDQQSTSLFGRKKQKKKKTKASIDEQKKQEAIAHFRKKHRIYVWGNDVPNPCPSFKAMIDRYDIPEGLAGTIKTALASWIPTDIQMQAIPIMLQNRELLASAPTGSGKTLAFVIPLLSYLRKSQKGGFRAVILEPTRELAKQVYREVLRMNEKLGLRVHMITNLDVAKEKFGPQSKRRLDILITTPNRLVHLLNQDPPCLSLSIVEWLIVDESDKLFETGTRGFRDQLAIIHQACDESRCKRAFFSATFSHDVEQWCKAYLDNVIMVSIGARNTAASTVDQELIFVGSEYGKLIALRNLVSRGLMPPVLIFVQTKERAQNLYREMAQEKLKVDVIHAGRDRKEREKVVKRFRAGEVWFLICTELMGRGMDFKNVNVVINYDFPPTAVSYIHRIGRTGRAGRRGKAVTFFTEYDRPLLRSIANVMREAGCPTPEYLLELKKTPKRLQRRLVRRCAERPSVTILRGKERNRNQKRKRKEKSISGRDQKKGKRRKVDKSEPSGENET